jgi:hypothetical protein
MNKIPKCKTKSIVIPQQPHYLKVNKKDISNEGNIPHKITQKKLKFNSNIRQFGKDITITLKNNNKEDQNSKANLITSNKVIQIYNNT